MHVLETDLSNRWGDLTMSFRIYLWRNSKVEVAYQCFYPKRAIPSITVATVKCPGLLCSPILVSNTQIQLMHIA